MLCGVYGHLTKRKKKMFSVILFLFTSLWVQIAGLRGLHIKHERTLWTGRRFQTISILNCIFMKANLKGGKKTVSEKNRLLNIVLYHLLRWIFVKHVSEE